MSTDENHRQAHMTLTARKICCVFAISSFKFGPATYFISHYCCGRALHAVFYKKIFKKREQSCLTVVLQLSCQRSHICCMVCMVLTTLMSS